jgi:hypothetical protein
MALQETSRVFMVSVDNLQDAQGIAYALALWLLHGNLVRSAIAECTVNTGLWVVRAEVFGCGATVADAQVSADRNTQHAQRAANAYVAGYCAAQYAIELELGG